MFTNCGTNNITCLIDVYQLRLLLGGQPLTQRVNMMLDREIDKLVLGLRLHHP